MTADEKTIREILLDALRAWEKYDAAIFVRGATGEDLELNPLGALANGVDLDCLYADARSKMIYALLAVEAEKVSDGK